MLRIAIAVVIGTAGVAWADPVPDAALRAVTDRSLRLELDDATTVEGKLLAFDAEWITLAAAGTNEVIAVPRARVRHVILASLATPPARALATTGVAVVAPERHRMWGLHFGLPGTPVGDRSATPSTDRAPGTRGSRDPARTRVGGKGTCRGHRPASARRSCMRRTARRRARARSTSSSARPRDYTAWRVTTRQGSAARAPSPGTRRSRASSRRARAPRRSRATR